VFDASQEKKTGCIAVGTPLCVVRTKLRAESVEPVCSCQLAVIQVVKKQLKFFW
jgi:hypothetical protein